MRIIISPAKKMKVDEDSLDCHGLPVFLKETAQIMYWMKSLSLEEQLQLLASNGMLVKRPLLVNGNVVVAGFRKAEWAEQPD